MQLHCFAPAGRPSPLSAHLRAASRHSTVDGTAANHLAGADADVAMPDERAHAPDGRGGPREAGFGRAERIDQPRVARGLTATLWVLAFVALANVVVSCVRLVSASPDRFSWLRLALELVVGGVLFACAWARFRSRGQSAPEDVVELQPIEATEWSSGDRRPSGDRTGNSKWLRRGRRLLTLSLVGVAAVSVTGQWGTVEAALGHVAHLQWKWVRWSIYAEALSIVAFAWLGLILLRAGGRRFSVGSLLALTLASNAVSVSMPGGAAWGAAFSFDQLRRRAVNRSLAAFVLFLMAVISAVALLVLLVVGVDVAGGEGPAAPFRTLATGLAVFLLLIALGLVAALRLPSARAALGRVVRKLPATPSGRVAELIRESRRELSGVRCTPRILAASLGAALLNWITDCACLVAAILAVAGHVPWRGVLVAYAIAQVAENLPITPGGIGIVEGTLSLLLIAYGMPTGTAVAAVLLYRIISFWIFVPIGWAVAGVLIVLQRRDRAHSSWIRVPASSPAPRPTAV